MIPGPLDELARWFVMPQKSGVYLTKSEIVVLARVVGASVRVSDRARMLADVLKSAGDEAMLGRIIQQLLLVCEAQRERDRALTGAYPVLAPLVADRSARVDATVARLREIADELGP